MQLLKELQASLGMAMILITHDLGVVFEMCDYVHVMYAGRIVESCSVEQLYDSPAHPYTRGLLDSLPHIDADEEPRQRLQTIPGNVPSIGSFPHGCRFSNRCARRTSQCDSSEPPLRGRGDGRKVACFHPLSARAKACGIKKFLPEICCCAKIALWDSHATIFQGVCYESSVVGDCLVVRACVGRG